jgi:hypothetical protein
MNQTKNKFSCLLFKHTKYIASIVFGLIFCVNLFGLSNITVSVNAAQTLIPIDETDGLFGTTGIGAVAQVTDGKFQGLFNCRKDAPAGWTNTRIDTLTPDCYGFFLDRVDKGDTMPSNPSLRYEGSTGYLKPVNQNWWKFENEYYIQAPNGNYRHFSFVDFKSQSGCDQFNRAEIENLENPACPKALEFVNKTWQEIGNEKTSNTTTTVGSETQKVLASADEKAKELSKNGLNCKGYTLNDQPAYDCRKDGKPVNPEGESFPDSCKPNSQGRIYFKLDSSGNATCTTEEETKLIDSSTGNNTNIASPTTTVSEGENAGSKIIEFVIDLVTGILAVLFWLAGTILGWVFWLVANIFLTVVRINPADAGFVEVAKAPWAIVVQLANILILASFIFVGLGYIIGIKSITGKKNTASDFLINIVIIGVAIQFTLGATSTFVNVVQGVGDLVYASYVRGDNSGNVKASENGKVIGNVLDSTKKVSGLRCDNISKCEGGEDTNGFVKGFGNIFGEGGNTTVLVREVLYVIVMLYTIFIFAKALKLALFRAIGLWLLMIVSPVALVLYLSPIDNFKKYAMQWLQLFWQMTLFYPAFVFALVIVNSLSGAFVKQSSNIAKVGSDPNILGGVSAQAAIITDAEMAPLIMSILAAVVAIFTFQIVIDFFEKGFGSIVSSALNTVTGALGGTMRGLGAVATAGVAARRGSQNLYDKFRDGNLKSLNRDEKLLKNDLKNATTKRDKTAIRSQLNDLRNQKEERRNEIAAANVSRFARSSKFAKRVRERLSNAADYVESADEILKAVGSLPAGYMANLKKGRQAKQARALEGMKGSLEKGVRKNKGLYNALAATGYNIDADPNMNRFAGLDPDTLNAVEDSFRLENKGKSYIDEEIKKRKNEAFKKTLGIKDTFDREVKDALLKGYDKKINNGEALSEKEQFMAKKLIEDSLEDPGLRDIIQNSPGLTKIAREGFSTFKPETTEKIGNKHPSLLASKAERIAAGKRIAGSPELDREMNAINLQDPDVLAGYLSVKGTSPETLEEINKRAPGALTAYSNLGDGQAKNDKRVTRFASSLTNEAEKAQYEENNRKVLKSGYGPQNETISKIARINADDSKDTTTKQIEIDQVWKDADAKHFGRHNGNNIIERDVDGKVIKFNENELAQMNFDQLAATEIGKTALKGKNISTFSPAQKTEEAKVLRANIARAAVNHEANSASYKDTINSTTKAFSSTIGEVKGKTAIMNTEMKALDDLTSMNVPIDPVTGMDMRHEYLRSGRASNNTHRTLGMQSQFDEISEAINKDGVYNKHGLNLDMKNMSAEEKSETLGDINKVIAGRIGGVQASSSSPEGKQYQEALNRLNSRGKGLDLFATAMTTGALGSTALEMEMQKKGKKRADVILENIDKTSQKVGGKVQYTKADTNDVLRKQIADTKTKKEKVIEQAKAKYSKTSFGDINNAMLGETNDSNYDNSTMPLPGGGTGGNVIASMDPRLSGIRGNTTTNNSSSEANSSSFSTSSPDYGEVTMQDFNDPMIISSTSGSNVQATRREILEDYKQNSGKFIHTPEAISANRYDDHEIAPDGTVYRRGLPNLNTPQGQQIARENQIAQDQAQELLNNMGIDPEIIHNQQPNEVVSVISAMSSSSSNRNASNAKPQTPQPPQFNRSVTTDVDTLGKSSNQRINKFNELKSDRPDKINYEYQNSKTQNSIARGKSESLGDIKRSVVAKGESYGVAVNANNKAKNMVSDLQSKLETTTGNNNRDQALRSKYEAELQAAQQQVQTTEVDVQKAKEANIAEQNRYYQEKQARNQRKAENTSGANTQGRYSSQDYARMQAYDQERKQVELKNTEYFAENERKTAEKAALKEQKIKDRANIDVSSANIPQSAYESANQETITANVQRYTQRQQELAKQGKGIAYNDLTESQRRNVAQGQKLTIDQEQQQLQKNTEFLSAVTEQQAKISQAQSKQSINNAVNEDKGLFKRFGLNRNNKNLNNTRSQMNDIKNQAKQATTIDNSYNTVPYNEITENFKNIQNVARQGEKQTRIQQVNSKNNPNSFEYKRMNRAQDNLTYLNEQNINLINQQNQANLQRAQDLQARINKKSSNQSNSKPSNNSTNPINPTI